MESRTYAVSSDNKAFRPNIGGYSIYASSLDGSDPCVRLEQYMASEYGGKNGWQIERCYMMSDEVERAKALMRIEKSMSDNKEAKPAHSSAPKAQRMAVLS